MARLYHDQQSGWLRSAFDDEVLDWPDVTSRKMFGCPAYRVNGTLFALVIDQGIVLTKLTEIDHQTLPRQFGAKQFQSGRQTIKRWLVLPINDLNALEPALPAIYKSYEIAQGLAL